MSATPWMTTDDLVEAIKRKIAMPTFQSTFSYDDIVKFLNEEMMISQVPRLLQYHEEYYVFKKRIPLKSNVSRYAIPDRAVGMRLRDIKFVDTNGNYFDLTQIPADDKAFFQRSIGQNDAIHKFYVEGNDIVLTPTTITSPTGSLEMFFYIRPNQLAANTRAAICSSLQKTITISNNATVTDSLSTVVIDNVSFVPKTVLDPQAVNEFLIGVDANATAANLAAAITNSASFSYLTATANSNTVTIISSNATMPWIVNNDANCYTFTNQHQVVCSTTIPSNITTSVLVDLLQTRPGHRTYGYDVKPQAVSGSTIVINDSDMPATFIVGDYICEQYECIIPYLPPDLHNGLAEMASSRILAAQGDAAGLQMAQAKIEEIDKQTNRIIADRAESTPLKLNARGSILRYGRMGRNRW